MRTANSDDAIVGITIANVTTSQISVEVYNNDGSNDIHIVKDTYSVGSSLQVLDGGAKIVMVSGDALKVKNVLPVQQMFGFQLLMQLVQEIICRI